MHRDTPALAILPFAAHLAPVLANDTTAAHAAATLDCTTLRLLALPRRRRRPHPHSGSREKLDDVGHMAVASHHVYVRISANHAEEFGIERVCAPSKRTASVLGSAQRPVKI